MTELSGSSAGTRLCSYELDRPCSEQCPGEFFFVTGGRKVMPA